MMDPKVSSKTQTLTSKTVAIIGAGVCGMTMTKACLEYDLRPTVFERTKFSCGLWRYRTNVEPGQGSVMRSTIVNSSKEMTAFSDFPFPEHYPNFMPNELMYEYLLEYAKSFLFDSYVQYEHEVLLVEHAKELNEGYLVTVKDINTGTVTTNRFDAVAVCSGHNHTPSMPNFPGQEQFKGRIVHSHSVRTNEEFRDKRLVVVGIGNSGGDVAAEAAPIARQVYISARRGGTWLIRRTGLNGKPIDTISTRRLSYRLLHMLPYSARNSVVESFMQRLVGHDLLGLRPNNRFFGQHAMVNDHIPTYIHLGWIKIRSNIERFTPDGVVFCNDGGRVIQCDMVVMATGYKCGFQFLSPVLEDRTDGHQLKLYKHVFDPLQPQPERLAFIGLPKASGSLPPIAEIQSRWFAMLLTGNCKPLPSMKKMHAQIKRARDTIAFRFGSNNVDKFIYEVEMLAYIDSLARSCGTMPHIVSYFFKDPKLWWALITKPVIAAQFRLDGHGAKPEQARQLIMTVMERIACPYRKPNLQEKNLINQHRDDRNSENRNESNFKLNKIARQNKGTILSHRRKQPELPSIPEQKKLINSS